MHLPINVLINLNDFIEKNIKLEGLPKISYQQYPYQGVSNITITYKNQTPIKHSCNQYISIASCPNILFHKFLSTRTNI